MPYDEQGAGANRLPHLLIPTIDTHQYAGIKWTVTCPYEELGSNEGCGIVEECNGTEPDVAKWGCELHPLPPSDYHEAAPASHEEWEAYEEARDRWLNEVHDGYRWHRTTDCWFAKVAVPNSDFEPEYFLADIPSGTPITGPLKVIVGYEGSDEDTEPKFKLWEEPTDAGR